MTTQQPWAVPVEALTWGFNEWLEAFMQDLQHTFSSSVVSLADYGSCELNDRDLAWLFEQHGSDLEEYVCEASSATFSGLAVLPINHVGQALCWLGY